MLAEQPFTFKVKDTMLINIQKYRSFSLGEEGGACLPVGRDEAYNLPHISTTAK
ncbi:MAG TPA: hypothetical protein VGP43_09105 [Chitinophagaceae bacterium]|nr:hypothetical protein [Chitinophagaceae bacterium]